MHKTPSKQSRTAHTCLQLITRSPTLRPGFQKGTVQREDACPGTCRLCCQEKQCAQAWHKQTQCQTWSAGPTLLGWRLCPSDKPKEVAAKEVRPGGYPASGAQGAVFSPAKGTGGGMLTTSTLKPHSSHLDAARWQIQTGFSPQS